MRHLRLLCGRLALTGAVLIGAAAWPGAGPAQAASGPQAAQASQAASSIVFTSAPGSSAPPKKLGPYTMTAFGADPQGIGAPVDDATGPTGPLGFSPELAHARVGDGWETWSNGYGGDVYTTPDSSITLTLPPDTSAFYFYAEPEQFQVFTITATSGDGTSSGAIPVEGEDGAQYFGFYGKGTATLSSVTVATADPNGFAVGEFGIAGGVFSVTGNYPVAVNDRTHDRNQSQDTHSTPEKYRTTTCKSKSEKADRVVGWAAVHTLKVTRRVPNSASLLQHFLDATGHAVSYADTSHVSALVKADPAFKTLVSRVQEDITAQLELGRTSVDVPKSKLSPPSLGDKSAELLLAFRGTQGVTVKGQGYRVGSRYIGSVTYTVKDSYGFTTKDVLLHVGTAMRYLQVNCGSSKGKAHWFPDSVTVDVPFDVSGPKPAAQPAQSGAATAQTALPGAGVPGYRRGNGSVTGR